MQQVARRWASQHCAAWQSQQELSGDGKMPASLMGDIFDQGWLPETLDDWGGATALILARLGEALAHNGTATFMLVLTHCLGLHLWGKHPEHVASADIREGLIATNPYIDHSRIAPSVSAVQNGSGWILDGQVPWVVNFDHAHRLMVAASEASGQVALFNVSLPQVGCRGRRRLSAFGLCSTTIHHLELASVAVSQDDVIVRGGVALASLREGYRIIRWGALGLVTGLVSGLLDQAKTYSELRMQGGRRIIENAPVRQLIDTAQCAEAYLTQSLTQLESVPQLECPSAEARQRALLASDSAFQVFGGSAYVRPGLPERCWRDVRQAVTLGSSSTAAMVPITAALTG